LKGNLSNNEVDAALNLESLVAPNEVAAWR